MGQPEDEGADPEEFDFKVGRLGELLVEQRLIEKGWHPVRLDTSQMAANADLLAINKAKRISIQVKTTNAAKKHVHSDHIGLGFTSDKSLDGGPVFNSKASPLIADVVVAVRYQMPQSKFVVLPVGLAENLCAKYIKYLKELPKKDGKTRKGFGIYLPYLTVSKKHETLGTSISTKLKEFEDRWDILKEEPEILRDPSKWPI